MNKRRQFIEEFKQEAAAQVKKQNSSFAANSECITSTLISCINILNL